MSDNDDLATTDPMLHPPDEPVPAGDHVEPGWLAERLRQRREELKGERTKDIEIPGYKAEGLTGRYKLLPYGQVRKISRRTVLADEKNPRANLEGQADLLIAACEMFLIRDGDELVPLHEALGLEQPVRYDRQLADTLGFEAEKARDVVFGVFPTEFAVGGHYEILDGWWDASDRDADEELLGESRAATL